MDKILLPYTIVFAISVIATVIDLTIGTQVTLKRLLRSYWFYLLFIVQCVTAVFVFYLLGTTEKFDDSSILDSIIVGFLFPMLLRSKFANTEKFSGLIDIYGHAITFIKNRIDEPGVRYRMKLTQAIMSHSDLEKLREVVFNHIEARNLTPDQKEFERRDLENRLREVEEQYQSPREIEKQKKIVFISYVFKNVRIDLEEFLIEFDLKKMETKKCDWEWKERMEWME